jgi:predicted HicB family RNase H-like nuclease
VTVNQVDEARASVDLNHYSYRVVWSPEDAEYVATALEWGPGLSWLDEDPTTALAGLRDLIRESIEDLQADSKPVPSPLADRDYSGRLLLRMPKPLHRDLAIHAAEENVSLNSLAVRLLAEKEAQHDRPRLDKTPA